MTDRQRNGFILLLVVGLVIASLIVIAGVPGTGVKSKKTVLGLDLKGGVELVYQGQPSAADAEGDARCTAAGGRHHAQPRGLARRVRAADPDHR